MNDLYLKPNDKVVLGRTIDNFPFPIGRKGQTVTVVRFDGHGILVRTEDGIPFYAQPEDLHPLGTVFDHEQPLSPVEVENRLDTQRFFVILIAGLVVIVLLFACFPQGL